MVCLYLCVCVFTQVEAVNGVSVPMYVCVYTSGSSKWCVCTCVCVVFTQVEAVNGVSVPVCVCVYTSGTSKWCVCTYVCVCLHKWKQ